MSVALWPIAGAFLAAVGSAALGWTLLTYRGSPGAKWFAATLGSQAVFCATVGISYLIFDPTLRGLLETVTWTALAVQVVVFLAFALSYSGRGHLVRTPWFRTLFAFPFVVCVVLATNRTHELSAAVAPALVLLRRIPVRTKGFAHLRTCGTLGETSKG